MPDQPLTRDAWVADFIVAVQRLRPDLVHSLKYISAVAQTEWARSSGKDDPHEAARQWNKRVKSIGVAPISSRTRGCTQRSQLSGCLVSAKLYAPESDPEDDIYRTNIQIAEVNALNAAIAVLRFKQVRGFYVGPATSHQRLLTLDNLSLLGPDED